jgi:hypothetical protein
MEDSVTVTWTTPGGDPVTENTCSVLDVFVAKFHKVETKYWTGLGVSIRAGWIETPWAYRAEVQMDGDPVPSIRFVLLRTQNCAPP